MMNSRTTTIKKLLETNIVRHGFCLLCTAQSVMLAKPLSRICAASGLAIEASATSMTREQWGCVFRFDDEDNARFSTRKFHVMALSFISNIDS